jgi:DNA polymerase alpha-associated DNA helicase A
MNQTMLRLQKMEDAGYSNFIQVLFGLSSPSPAHEASTEFEWFDATLNESQKSAIKFALASPEIALIHGPPGVSEDGCYERYGQ